MVHGVLNRLKATLSDANQTDKWLFVPLGKVPVSISKWGTNTTPSDLLTLSRTSDLLHICVRENLWSVGINLPDLYGKELNSLIA